MAVGFGPVRSGPPLDKRTYSQLLHVTGRRWRWQAEAVIELAEALADLSFEVSEPELTSLAFWVSRGLTAYDAAYVALAERRQLALVTDDGTIIELAPEISRQLVGGPARAG